MTKRLHFHFSLSCIGEGNGNPLQCSCLENPRDGGTWWAAIYGVTQGRTRLKRRSSSFDSDLTNTTAPTVICLPWKTTKYLNANHLMSTHSDNTNAGIMPTRNMGTYVVWYERTQINDKHSFKKYLLVFTMSKILIISPRDGKLWKKVSINQPKIKFRGCLLH